MSRWEYDITAPPPKAFEAVEAAQALLVSANLLSGATLLGAPDPDGNAPSSPNAQIYAHEDPVEAPANRRWVTVREFQELGARMVGATSGIKVVLHVTVDGPVDMENWAKWHAAMHDRIDRSLTGQTLTLSFSEVALRLRQVTAPSRPEYQEDTDTRMSFAQYAVTLQPN